MASVSGSGPTVPRILLGARLRRLRETAKISREDAALVVRCSVSKIRRMEGGRHACKVEDVDDLLVFYDVTEPGERQELLTLARLANEPGWWVRYSDVLPRWYEPYVGLESAASRVRAYAAQCVPDLLQTPRYAAAVISLRELRPAEIERKVTVRTARQRRFLDGELRLWAIIDEAALRRPIGGREVMREQLEYLLSIAKLPNLTLQVATFGAGGHAAPGSFSILRFCDPDLNDVVYVEQLTNALYLDERDDVDAYAVTMERLSVLSTFHEQSGEVINTILEQNW